MANVVAGRSNGKMDDFSRFTNLLQLIKDYKRKQGEKWQGVLFLFGFVI